MDRKGKINLLNDLKTGKTTITELIQRSELPEHIVFIDGITEINGEKLTQKEFYKRFPGHETTPPINVNLHFDID